MSPSFTLKASSYTKFALSEYECLLAVALESWQNRALQHLSWELYIAEWEIGAKLL